MKNCAMYRDYDDQGNESITVYINQKCVGSYLPDEILVRDLEARGVEIEPGLDDRK